MPERLNEILYRVAEEILESLAFMFPVLDEERKKISNVFVWGASISFVGPFSGRMVILASEKILPDLVTNMLGLDAGEEVSLAQQHDALMELLSIVCGNVLPVVAGKKAMFNLDVPKILSSEEYDALMKKQDPVSQVTLELENGQADFILFIEEGTLSLKGLPAS
jgi:hypothetical protein